ncbi:hypothetical protein [Actinoallomurus soli]|uniref:hypothetical protein n=1 Tax=Actinoallomurus soli TaxID=2952535 RepID=UPI0020928562|nr:hypothetical protein [Actinoallomurus soli]MCO5970847.1 hypothetical protein [Actinoallomurus soli]
MNGVTLDVALAVGITALVIVLQFATRPVRWQAWIWVLLCVARGLVPPGPARATTAGITLLVVSLIASAFFGALRGRTMRMWRDRDGVVYRRGGGVTLLLWLATIATRLVLTALGHAVFDEPIDLDALWLGLGVTLAAQQLVMTRRAGRLPQPDPRPARPARTR